MREQKADLSEPLSDSSEPLSDSGCKDYADGLPRHFFNLKFLLSERLLALKNIRLNDSFSNLKEAESYVVNDADEYNLLLMAYIIKNTMAIETERRVLKDYTAAVASLYLIYLHLHKHHLPFRGAFRGSDTRDLPKQLPYYLSQIEWDDRRYRYGVKRNITQAMHALKNRRIEAKSRRNPIVRACYSVLRYIGKIFGVVSTVVDDSFVLSWEQGIDEDTREDRFRLWTKALTRLNKDLDYTKIKEIISDFEQCFLRGDLITAMQWPDSWVDIHCLDRKERVVLYRQLLKNDPTKLFAIAAVTSPIFQKYFGIVTPDHKGDLMLSEQYKTLKLPGEQQGMGRIHFATPIANITAIPGKKDQYSIHYGVRSSDSDDASNPTPVDKIVYGKALYASATIMSVAPGVKDCDTNVCEYNAEKWKEFSTYTAVDERGGKTKDEGLIETKTAGVKDSHAEICESNTEQWQKFSTYPAVDGSDGETKDESFYETKEGGFDSDIEPTSPVQYDPESRQASVVVISDGTSRASVLANHSMFSKLHHTAKASGCVDDKNSEYNANLRNLM
ncbi:MAG: hypothetical protein P1U34_11820 [Coxiellaceae bacterium]|nr:hypothetical protein [Coxiellaceae bacterium]